MSTENDVGTGVSEMWVSGRNEVAVEVARGRFEFLDGAMWRRLDDVGGGKFIGEAFRVQVTEIGTLVADPICRTAMELIADQGEKLGVVLLVHAPTLDEVTAALATSSTKLAAALIAGRTVRYVEPIGAPGLARPRADDAAEALVKAARMIADVDDPAEFVAALSRALGEDSPESRGHFTTALRHTADMLDAGPWGGGPPRRRVVSTPSRDRWTA